MPKYLDKSEVVFKGSYFDVSVQDIMIDSGKVFSMQFVKHPGAVAILPLLDNDTVVMIRNERYAVSESLWEVPAGTLELGELPFDTAHRELIEETGYSATNMEKFMEFYATPGYSNEKLYGYIAKDLTLGKQNLDESETISVHPLPIQKALEMVRDGEITDGKTVTMLLFYKQFYASIR